MRRLNKRKSYLGILCKRSGSALTADLRKRLEFIGDNPSLKLFDYFANKKKSNNCTPRLRQIVGSVNTLYRGNPYTDELPKTTSARYLRKQAQLSKECTQKVGRAKTYLANLEKVMQEQKAIPV